MADDVLDDVAGEMIGGAPAVTPKAAAVDADDDQEEKKPRRRAGGRRPKRRRRGSSRRKAAPSPSSSASSPASSVGASKVARDRPLEEPDPEEEAAELEAEEEQYRKLGAQAAQSLFLVGRTLGGEEWAPVSTRAATQPIDFDEAESVAAAFAEYFKAAGVTTLPPGFALGMALAAYAGPRLFLPQTKSRLARLKAWAAGKLGAWWARRRVAA